MNSWQTDAYLMAVTYNSSNDKTKAENIKDLLVAHGSYLRCNGKPHIYALSKYTALIKNFNTSPQLLFPGQRYAKPRFYSVKNKKLLPLKY